MTSAKSRLSSLVKASATALASVGVPVVAIVSQPSLRDNPWVTLGLIVAYELILALGAFATSVAGKVASKWQERVAEAADSWLRRRFSGYTCAYLKYVEASCRYLELKGLAARAEYTLEMREVFVNLALDTTALHKLTSNPVRQADAQPPPKTVSAVWHWIRECSRGSAALAIVGPPGSGKTTLLKHVAVILARGGKPAHSVSAPSRLPVFISLREHKDLTSDGHITLADVIRRSLPELTRAEPPRWVETNLLQGRFALLFDGLDEIQSADGRREASSWLDEQNRSGGGNLIVVTSRKFGYHDNPLTDAIVVQVRPFTDSQVVSFVERWYAATAARSYGDDNQSARISAQSGSAELLSRLHQKQVLNELASNPLLLTMIVNVHYYSGALPGSRSELYRQICDVFLGRRHQARGIAVEIPAARKSLVLRELAFSAMRKGVSEISLGEAVNIIEPPLARVSGTATPEEFLRAVEHSAGILVERERGLYAFAHLTFQEFLAAEYICENNLLDGLVAEIESIWWRETIRLVAALGDATPIVKACLSHPADPHLLALAVQCVEEAREVSPELRSLVSARLNPPDIGENRDNRRIAAWARLLLRPSKDLRLERGKFIGPEFTWVEYQCFLDDAATRGQVHIPDHWVEAVFPPGTEDQPAHGVRYDDARAFCGWLQSELGGDDIYRLPSSREIDAAISLSTDSTRIEEARWPVWSITKQAIGVDGRFGVLLRDRRANERNVPYLGARTSLSPADRNILRSIEAEQAKLSAPGFTASATQGRPSSDMACQLLEEAWSSFSACDAGQLARDMQTSSSLLRQYIDKCSLPGEGADLQNALVHMADVLDAEAPASFDRRAYKWRQSDRALESRRKLRLAVLYAGDACAQLHSLHNQAARQAVAGRWVGRRAHRYRKEAPARTVAVLAQALMEIYVELVVLEGRVRKLLQPTECVRMVRLTTGQESEGLVDLDEQIRDRDWNLWLDLGKPVVDRLVAACALIALLPFLLVVAAIVRTDGGPVLFFQTRIGKRGRQFNMVKFRSMVVDADRLRAELLEANEGAGPLFKMRADPRVTKFGRWMRRYGIDEFPQLLNVLAGSMSLVGPRPPLPGGVSTFSAEASRKFLVKPGLTGLGQVSGGSDISWEELVRLDLRYVENASLALDSTILVRTLGSLISGSGRY